MISTVWYMLSGLVTFAALLAGWLYTRSHNRAGQGDTTCTAAKPQTSTAAAVADAAEGDVNNSWPLDESYKQKMSEEKPPNNSTDQELNRDPMQYYGHIQREYKRAKHQATLSKITSSMSEEQLETEREIQRNQLHEIFRLLESEKDKYGISSVSDIEEQIKLYV